MTADLPPAVQNYFAGKNARDFDLAVSGFAAAAVVADEAKEHVGPAAIRQWMEDTAARYGDKAEVIDASSEDGSVEVRAEVSGSFPASPIVLRFTFSLNDGAVSRLEIRP